MASLLFWLLLVHPLGIFLVKPISRNLPFNFGSMLCPFRIYLKETQHYHTLSGLRETLNLSWNLGISLCDPVTHACKIITVWIMATHPTASSRYSLDPLGHTCSSLCLPSRLTWKNTFVGACFPGGHRGGFIFSGISDKWMFLSGFSVLHCKPLTGRVLSSSHTAKCGFPYSDANHISHTHSVRSFNCSHASFPAKLHISQSSHLFFVPSYSNS